MVYQYRNIMAFMYIFAHPCILRRKRRGIEPQGIYIEIQQLNGNPISFENRSLNLRLAGQSNWDLPVKQNGICRSR
jgi:hypothetical protein